MESPKTGHREMRQHGLADQLVRKLEPGFRILRARADNTSRLSFIHPIQQRICLDAGHGLEKLEGEGVTDHRRYRKNLAGGFAQPSESSADDQAHIARHLQLPDLQFGAKLAGVIVQSILFCEMLEQFFDEKWIAAGFPKNLTYHAGWWRLAAEALQHFRDRAGRKSFEP
jgi:hypothetical protein